MRLRRAAVSFAAALAAACTSPQPCPNPLEECDGQCVDIQSDRRHCGACGRTCRASEVCAGAACNPDPRAPCPDRTNGAFVTLGHCGRAVKLWVRQSVFIARAKELLAGDPSPPAVPSLSVIAGSDCDAQWSWHTDDADAAFVDAPPTPACDVCPDVVQANVAAYSGAKWCPATGEVLAVDDRRPPSLP
jgi:hypothetical protein